MKKDVLARLPLIALAALPLTVGLVVAQTSSSASPSAPQRVQPLQPGQRNQQTQPNQQVQPRQQSGTNYADVFLQKLAAQLGISVDRLKAAAQAAGKSTLEQGVKAGDFPAEMAQHMTQRLQDDPFALAGGRGGHGQRGGRGHDDNFGGPGNAQGFQGNPSDQQMGRGSADRGGADRQGARGGFGQAVTAAVARALNLTEQQLFTQLQGGQSVAQLAQARGVSTATLHTVAVNALKTQLQADVSAGRLTQAQAAQMVTQAQADPNFGLNFGRGGRRGQDDQGDTETPGDTTMG
ncbi:hypothetical protein D3875_19440 [Deinococcus cavernae]|uniref:DUF2680 domain-containing protein n=1 Tax=Deinococcus cavernae TaxID=2320857 RepID=A0A418VB78_9DEIO|nr:hypothetical protein [Deinococcus cavernae]RJF73395.1 hypothetical protein D3875_19440 [Deinococcus cavernae]